MDLVADCKEKLSHFRIKELKDALTMLGLPKQGRKQELLSRIVSLLSDEQEPTMLAKKKVIRKETVAKFVDDIYRGFISGATDLASQVQNSPDCSNGDIAGECNAPFLLIDTKVRCPCGESLQADSMIKCEDPTCDVSQHIGCVLIPQETTDENMPIHNVFYCELCRLSRADPFLVSMGHPLFPVMLTPVNVPTDGTNPVQSVDKTFQLTRADKELLKQEFDVQAWCMLLNDKVPFRMQWPQYADLQVNGIPVRAINRPGSQLLGSNGRDDGPIITPCTKDGINKISLSGCDARTFCLGVRIVKRRTVQQIFTLIPKESDGERFDDALARVCRCIGGGGTAEADSDSDLEVVADSFGVNLRCPMSGSRIKVAGRFKPCAHMGCFDLDVFVELNQRSRKWQCPICMQNYSLDNLIIDPYFNRVASLMRSCGEDITDIEVKSDGSWRVKAKHDMERATLGSLCFWHSPDGTLCRNIDEDETESKAVNQIELKVDLEGNTTGFFGTIRPNHIINSSSNGVQEVFGDLEANIITMSSSNSGNSRGGEEPSVDCDGGRDIGFATVDGIELDSVYSNMASVYGHPEQNPLAHSEVIVLSDSDEDNDVSVAPVSAHGANQTEPREFGFTVPGGADSYGKHAFGTCDGSGFDLLKNNPDEYEGISDWSTLPSGSQSATSFQLFCQENNVSGSLFNLQHDSLSDLRPSTNGGSLEPQIAVEEAVLVPQAASVAPLDGDMDYGLVDDILANGRDDPSSQIFFPATEDTSNGICSGDWISLQLADGAQEVAPLDVRDPLQQSPSREATPQLPSSGDNRRQEKTGRPGSPFSFPRQRRSVRPRLCDPANLRTR